MNCLLKVTDKQIILYLVIKNKILLCLMIEDFNIKAIGNEILYYLLL